MHVLKRQRSPLKGVSSEVSLIEEYRMVFANVRTVRLSLLARGVIKFVLRAAST